MTNPADLAHYMTSVTTWWASLPAAARKPYYRPQEIQAATGTPAVHLPPVLELLGWHRACRWGRENNRRKLRTYYAPPGRRVPTPMRGRPPLALLAAFTTTPCNQ